METFSGLLGWLTFAAAMIATVTVSCLLATVVQVASGAGCYGGRPLPGGVTRRAEEVEARLRARYRPDSRAPEQSRAVPERATIDLEAAADPESARLAA